ncbi:unnamed protein product [Closterium sp. NIES-64]|nr:unnamed protein product [Closterium sp. NIES-64]
MTEILNREALAVMLAREEEVKRKAVVEKAIFGGPQIRFHSKDGKNTLEFTKVAAVPPEINAKAPSYPAKPTCVITGLPANPRMRLASPCMRLASPCQSPRNSNGDDAEEDWPENGHDDSASGDDVGPADIEEDDWWNRPVGSDDEVEEWHVGDSDNDGGKDAHGNNAEAAADAQEATVDANEEADDEAGAELETFAPADATAVADAEGEEGGDDNPWSFGTDDDVPLLKRRLRHRL